MPIKVHCKECDTTFSVKDEAAGKRVRCKGCGSPVKVPSGEKRKKRAATASKSADTDDFLASFDIDKIEDKEARICPRCGHDADEEDIECSNCGVNLTTGRLSEKTRKKRRRKGPAIEEFYSKSWGDAYTFLGNHKGLATKTFLYSFIASTLFFSAIFMMFWCHRTPPRAFWGFIAFVSIMAVPGWIWFIQTEVVRYALQKKDKLKRINFDFFLCSALGMKFIFWIVLFSLPAQAVFGTIGYYYITNGSIPIGAALIAVGFIPTFLMFPLAMPHMTVADSTPGWLVHKLGRVFLTLAKPALFWCFVFFVTTLPALGCLAAIGAISGSDLDTFFSNVRYNSAVAADNDAKEWADENKIEDFVEGPMVGKKPVELQPKVLILPSILWLFACLFYAPTLIYNARVNGLLAVHCKPDLQLITKLEEVKYVSKAEREKTGPPTPRWQLSLVGIGIGVVVGIAMFFLIPLMPLLLLRVLLIIMGVAQIGCLFNVLAQIKQKEGLGFAILGFFVSIYAYVMGWIYAKKDKEIGGTMMLWTLFFIASTLTQIGLVYHAVSMIFTELNNNANAQAPEDPAAEPAAVDAGEGPADPAVDAAPAEPAVP
ncbi:hypothetical protein FYZ48_12965 [Gimesia chilikensis]|uniref:hypothetical protein n=1 Tax=Gimesia chilikensis TaxID=2605989 RepID=UPI0011EF7257|nr:hypothetical protein [Gimesia chilikensis]KAA0138396.1 hypothetical protein FYZ48_12965 [Gimesia chilikensis]